MQQKSFPRLGLWSYISGSRPLSTGPRPKGRKRIFRRFYGRYIPSPNALIFGAARTLSRHSSRTVLRKSADLLSISRFEPKFKAYALTFHFEEPYGVPVPYALLD